MEAVMEAVVIDAKYETYCDIEKMLYKMAWQTTKKFGGDFQEHLSAANEAFSDAYISYREGMNTSFSTWLYWQVRGRLQRSTFRNKMEQHTVNTGEDIDLSIFSCKDSFDLHTLLNEVSHDARVAIELIMDSDFVDLDLSRETVSCIRSGLAVKLQEIGWTTARIVDAFFEVKEALCQS
jgi:hypothetical protein